MNKQKFFTFLYCFLIIALILFMLWVVIWLKGTSKDCLLNPLEYHKSKQDNIECYCYKLPVFVDNPTSFEDLNFLDED